MKITKSQIAIIVISFALSIYFYPQLPDKMATHWNAKGEVDNYMGKEVGAFLMPCIIAGVFLLFMLIIQIDPLKKNIEKFKSYYFSFIIAMCLFLFGIHWWMMLWNIGVKVSVNRVMPAAIGALYFFIGYIMKNFKRNWFIGIRTPWTLSNEIVWKRTHEVSGRLFMASSVIAMCGVFFPEYSLLLILAPILATAVFALVYSYVVYKKVSNAEIDGTADEMRVGERSGDTTWDNIKEGYLYQVERSLLKVKHPAKKQVLEDVSSHLDQRFSELGADEQTWENMQQIITEMGPASDYAELLVPETLAGRQASGRKSLMGVVISAVAVIVTVLVLVTVLSNKQEAYELREVSDVENLGHPFENDPEVIGYWKSMDFVEVVEDFAPETKVWKGDLFLKDFTFKPNGRTLFSWTWTKDWIWHDNGRTKAQYKIKQMAGETYLFLPWLSGDVTIRHQKPSYYVLKKEPVETDIAIEDIRIQPYRQGGLYSVTVSIRNKGEGVSPKFGVYFYQGDPGDAKPMTHGAGPIDPGDVWNECSMPFALKEGTNQITAIIDPDDSVAESDENNNRAWIRLIVNEDRITDKTTGFGKSRMEKKPATDGVDSARTWLKFIDDGNYARSWEEAAQVFKNAATKEQ